MHVTEKSNAMPGEYEILSPQPLARI